MADLENDPENLQPSDEGLAQSKGILGQMGGALAYLPTEFVKGGAEFARKFGEGGKMVFQDAQNVGVLPGGPGPDLPHTIDPDFADVQGGSSTASAPRQGSPEAPIDVGDVTPVQAATAPVSNARQAVSGGRRATAAAAGSNDVEPPIDLSQTTGIDHGAALAAQGVDPTVARYLADKQRQQDQLTAAQKESEGRMRYAMAMNSADVGFGVSNPAEMAARLAYAGKPTADVQAQQEAAGKSLEQASKEQTFFSEADKANPGSEANKAFHQLYKSAGINIPPGLTIANSGKMGEDFLRLQEGKLTDARRLKQEREGKAADYNKAEMMERHADYRAGLKLKDEKKATPIPTVEADQEANDQTAFGAEGNIREAHKNIGPSGVLKAVTGISVGASKDYDTAVDVGKGPIAAQVYKGARAAGPKMVEQAVPTAVTPSGNADRRLGVWQDQNIASREHRIQGWEARFGKDHPQVADARTRLEADKQALAASRAGGGGAKLQAGERLVHDPQGKPHALKQGYPLPKGWTEK